MQLQIERWQHSFPATGRGACDICPSLSLLIWHEALNGRSLGSLLRGSSHVGAQVDRTAYIPEPNVDGAVVRFRLKQRSAYPLQDDLAFNKMVRKVRRVFVSTCSGVLQLNQCFHGAAGTASIYREAQDAAQHASLLI